MAQNPEKPRICFITTGGEITKTKNSYGDPRDISPDLQQIANLDVERLEFAQGDVLGQMGQTIYSRLNDYDGFVVTGGKHDLQIVAPRLAFALGPNLDKTVVVTGSNIAASFVHSGARERLVRAVMVASTPFKEVVIAFEDLIVRGTSFQIGLKGSHLLSYNPYFERGYLGEITGMGLEVNHLETKKSGEVNFMPDFENNVAAIGISPGTEPKLVESATVGRAGVILSTDGRSLPFQAPYSLLPLLAELSLKGIPVLIASRVRDAVLGEDHQTRYAEESIIEQFGCIVVRNMNFMVATTKFSWVLRRVAEEIASGKLPQANKLARVKEWMETSYVGEFGIHRPFNAIQV